MRYEFERFQQKIRNYGGEAAVREDYNTNRRNTSSPKLKGETKRSRPSYNQNLAWWRKMNKNKPIPTTQITNLSSSLDYDHKRENKCKAMKIDGSTVSFDFNKVTAKRKKGKLTGKDKAQLTAEHLSNKPAPLITPQHSLITRSVLLPQLIEVSFPIRAHKCVDR